MYRLSDRRAEIHAGRTITLRVLLVSSDSPTSNFSVLPLPAPNFALAVAAPKIWNSLLQLSERVPVLTYLPSSPQDTVFQQAFQPTERLSSCASDSAFAGH